MAMKIKEIRSMQKEDLNAKVAELKKELMKANAQVATGTTPKNAGQIKHMKKTIARIFTVLHQASRSSKQQPQERKDGKPLEVKKKHE